MFEGQTIWVTGASSGIGAAFAEAAAARGARLVLSGRREDALQAVAGRLPTESLVLPFEATDWAALAPAVARAGDWRGGIDMLVNNAGISQRSLAVDTRPEVYRQILDVDLLAPIWLTQLVLPGMVARGTGHIVAISSVAGRVGTVLRTAYCAAKHGLIGYADALRAEVEQAYGLRVTTVLPGSVRTMVAANALQADGTPRGESDVNIEAGMPPEACVRQILAGIEAGQREIIVAEGGEQAAAAMRVADPDRLFDALAREGARLAEARAAGARPDPRQVKNTVDG
jgi:short-subunit dehydrogenase